MAVDGVPNLNNTTSSEAVRDAYQEMATSRKKTGSNDDTGVDLMQSVSGVDISSAGQNLSLFEDKLNQIEDTEKREQAKSGFKQLMQKLTEETDPTIVDKFIETWERAQDRQAVEDSLAEAGRSEEELDLGSFVDELAAS